MTGEAFRKLTVGFLIAVVWLPIEFHFLEAKNTTPVTQKSNANSRNSEHAGYGYSVYNVKELLVVLSSAYDCQSSRAENATVKARLPCRGYCCECRVGHWSYPSVGRFRRGPLINNAKKSTSLDSESLSCLHMRDYCTLSYKWVKEQTWQTEHLCNNRVGCDRVLICNFRVVRVGVNV